jgi:hypothetical protein
VPGVASDKEGFETAVKLFDQLGESVAARGDKYSPEWLDRKLDVIWAYSQWAKIDGSKADLAKNVINQMETDYDPGFAAMDEPYQSRFKWLSRQLR